MAKGNWYGKVEGLMMENGKKVSLMDLASNVFLMEVIMKETFKTVTGLEKARTFYLMAKFMKENLDIRMCMARET